MYADFKFNFLGGVNYLTFTDINNGNLQSKDNALSLTVHPTCMQQNSPEVILLRILY